MRSVTRSIFAVSYGFEKILWNTLCTAPATDMPSGMNESVGVNRFSSATLEWPAISIPPVSRSVVPSP